MTGRSGASTVKVAGALIVLLPARSLACTYRVYVPFHKVPVYIVPVVAIVLIVDQVIKSVYPERAVVS